MNELPPCPKCQSPYVYEDGILLTCPECAYEWPKDANNKEVSDSKKLASQ